MAISPISSAMAYNNTPNFKGAPKIAPATVNKADSMFSGVKKVMNKGWDNFIEDCVVKPIVVPAMNSKFMGWLADKSANIDNMASHMSTAGSFVTTAVYANRTLNTLNKDEEQKKRAKVLAMNQILVTGLSTLGAYTINDKLGKFSKNLGYKFREANQGSPKLSKRMQGFNIAKQLLIFTLMYRYVAPVVVTPVASKLGKLFESKGGKKEQATVQSQPQSNNTQVASK